MYPYLYVPESRNHLCILDSISIDQNFIKHFPWYWIGKAHEWSNNRDETIVEYDKAINKYRAVVEGKSNRELKWVYTAAFSPKERLSKSIIWVALGEAYSVRGST